MKLLEKRNLTGLFLLIAMTFTCVLEAQVNTKSSSRNTQLKPASSVTFTPEDIEKVKTLIEEHLNKKVSTREFEAYGKATKENLQLFKEIDETKKSNPFFSQPHISFIINSMSERLGVNKPKPNSNIRTAGKRKRKKM